MAIQKLKLIIKENAVQHAYNHSKQTINHGAIYENIEPFIMVTNALPLITKQMYKFLDHT